MISDLVITYGGNKLTDYFDLTSEPIGRNLPNRENSIQQMGLTNGAHYIGTRYTERIITLNIYSDKYSVDYVKNKINGLLNVKEPQPLIFSDRPNEVWYAILDGESVMTRSIDSLTEITGELSFLVPSGYCEALNPSTFTATPNADGILTMQIANNGTETAEMSFEATMTDDNGYLGAVGPLGAVEFGNLAEADGYIDMSEMVLRKELNQAEKPNFKTNGGYIQWKKSNGGLDNKIQGDFDWSSDYRAVATNFGTAFTDNRWYGPTLSIGIPEKSDSSRNKNWQSLIWLQHKSKNNAKTLGRQEFNYSKGDSSVISFTVYDDKAGSMDTIFEFRVFGQVKESFHVNSDFKEFWGGFQLFKIGNSIQFKIVNNYNQKTLVKTYIDDLLEDVEVDTFTYWAAKFKNYPHCEMSLNHINFSWIGTQDFVDVPNRYSSGDTLKYVGTNGKFYVNDLLTMNDIIQGSTDLKIPPGNWTVEFYYSDFGKTPPNIVGTLRERWL